MEQETITITVLDQEYKIKCSQKEIESLQKSAAFLDIKMSEIKKSVPTMTKDKIAVMAALNIVSSYLNQEDELKEFSTIGDEIESLQKSIDSFGMDE